MNIGNTETEKLALSFHKRNLLNPGEEQAVGMARTILRSRDNLVVIGPYYPIQSDYLHPRSQGTILVAPEKAIYSLKQMLALERKLVRRLALTDKDKYYPCDGWRGYALGHVETKTPSGKNLVYFYPSVEFTNLAILCAGASLIARQAGIDVASSAGSTPTIRTQLLLFSGEAHILCKEVFEGKVSPQEIQIDYEKWLKTAENYRIARPKY